MITFLPFRPFCIALLGAAGLLRSGFQSSAPAKFPTADFSSANPMLCPGPCFSSGGDGLVVGTSQTLSPLEDFSTILPGRD